MDSATAWMERGKGYSRNGPPTLKGECEGRRGSVFQSLPHICPNHQRTKRCVNFFDNEEN
jgi:hypothetical protein